MKRYPHLLVFPIAMVLLLGTVAAAMAQEAASASSSSFGLKVLGLIDPGTPAVSAEIPPGETDEQSEELIEIPAEPLVQSATASVDSRVSATADIEAALQDKVEGVNPGAPDLWNATGFAVIEDLEALDGNLTADLIAAEALASCVDGELVLASASEFENVTLGGGDPLPLEDLEQILGPIGEALRDNFDAIFGETTLLVFSDQPNDVVLEVPELGIRIIAWETNWDGDRGTTDGSDTVFVNGLRIQLDADSPFQELFDALEPLVGEEVDIVLAHAEATADCDAAAGPGPSDPLGGITKSASSQTVAPGDAFTYTIVVPNGDDTCTLTDVNVVDTITGPAGSEILSTSPEADSVEGLTVTWDDIGPIEPGDSVTLTIEVQVPDDAPDGAEYSENLAVTADCDGEPVDGGLDFDGPTVAAPGPAPGAPTPSRDLPDTGGGLLLGLLALGGAAGLHRLRRP